MPGACGKEAWRVSLHGGHSSGYCDHAADPLAEMLAAAAAGGMAVFGVTEHAPRVEPERLYDEERVLGWTVDTLASLFAAYAAELDRLDLIDEYKLLVHPRIAGHGPTLYESGLPSTRRLELVSAKPLRNGAVAMHYRRAR